MASTWSPSYYGWLLRIFTLSFCPALGLGFLRYDQTDTWWAFQPWFCFWISVHQMSWCSSLALLKVLQSHCQKRCSSRTTARDNLLVPGEYLNHILCLLGRSFWWFSSSHLILRRMIEGFYLVGVSCVGKVGKKHYSSGCLWAEFFLFAIQLCEHMKFNFNPPLCQSCEVPVKSWMKILH